MKKIILAISLCFLILALVSCSVPYQFSDDVSNLEEISIEIVELDDKFLNVLKNSKKIVNHIHIPLQSGCDKILKLMNRRYDMKYYVELFPLYKFALAKQFSSTDAEMSFWKNSA